MATAACRRITSSSSTQPALTVEARLELTECPTTVGQVCRDLEELCAAGFLEAFRDEYNIVRYRPVHELRNGRVA